MALFSKRRHEPTQSDFALRGLVFAIVAVLLCGFLALKLQGSFDDTMPVTARLQSAGGSLRPGVDVKMRGMIVGKVAAIDGDASHVDLALRINNDQVDQIPSNVRARVLPASVFGTSYVDLVAPDGAGSASMLRAEQIIRQDESQQAVELQTALDSIDSLVDALGPGELAAALHTVASALSGRGDDLGDAIETFNAYLGKVSPKVPQIRRDLRLLTVNLNAIDRNAPDALEAVDDARITVNRLVDRRKKIEKLLGGAAALLEDTNSFLTVHEAKYLRALGLSQTLIDAVFDERGNLRATLLAFGTVSNKLLSVLEDGYGRVEGIVYTSGPGDYTRADCIRYGTLKADNCE